MTRPDPSGDRLAAVLALILAGLGGPSGRTEGCDGCESCDACVTCEGCEACDLWWHPWGDEDADADEDGCWDERCLQADLEALRRRQPIGAVGSVGAVSETADTGGDGKTGAEGSAAERGSGTVLLLAVILVLAVITVASVAVGSAVVARHRAMSGADLAALAAADAVARADPDPCGDAARVAHRQSVALVSCSTTGLVADVVVAVPVQVLGVTTRASMRSRAGPVADDGLG